MLSLASDLNRLPEKPKLAHDLPGVAAGAQMEALFMDVEGARPDDAIGRLPEFPIPLFFPQQASITLLPLSGPDYQTQVRANHLKFVDMSLTCNPAVLKRNLGHNCPSRS